MRQEEEDMINSLSLILKYNKDGTPTEVIGNRLKRSNKIFPFQNMEKFTIDRENNIFVYIKNNPLKH